MSVGVADRFVHGDRGVARGVRTMADLGQSRSPGCRWSHDDRHRCYDGPRDGLILETSLGSAMALQLLRSGIALIECHAVRMESFGPSNPRRFFFYQSEVRLSGTLRLAFTRFITTNVLKCFTFLFSRNRRRLSCSYSSIVDTVRTRIKSAAPVT